MTPREIPQSANEYAIGWIAALPLEKAAAMTMLDERYDPPEEFTQHQSDGNSYTWGRIAGHNMVIASLPPRYGTVSAAQTASNMLTSLPNIKLGLLVGIAAGIPSAVNDVRLGDVVVSQPNGTNSGIVQYDLGKVKQGGGWEPKGVLASPAMAWQHAMTSLQAEHLVEDSKMSRFLEEAAQKYPKWSNHTKPPNSQDQLFESAYIHQNDTATDCSECDSKHLQARADRYTSKVKIFYGTVASGNSLVKDAHTRNEIGRRIAGNCCCLEMEAAGIMDIIPCVVIRGICDYADTHKNDHWQGFAASTAAAYAKELLLHTRVLEVRNAPIARDALNLLKAELVELRTSLRHVNESRHEDKVSGFLRALHTCPYGDRKDRNEKRIEGTCQWFRNHATFQNWISSCRASFLWLAADPGCGKSVLSRWLVDELFRELYDESELAVCYFFFRDDIADQQTVVQALCAILRQLFLQQPQLLSEGNLAQYAQSGSNFISSFHSLWILLVEASMNEKATDIVCVLDGLDEATEGDCQQLIRAILELYDDPHNFPRIKFLATSRPYGYINDAFSSSSGRFSRIDISGNGHNESDVILGDVDIVIRHRIKALCKLRELNLAEEELLIHSFTTFENRTYLWAALTLSLIEETEGLTKAKILDLLKNLPATVNDAYEKILTTRVDKKKATLALQMIIAATRPFHLQELAITLSINRKFVTWGELSKTLEPEDRFRRTIRNYCGLFIIIRGDQVYLLHQTARQFLLQNDNGELNTDYNRPVSDKQDYSWGGSAEMWTSSLTRFQCNARLAKRCLWFLNLDRIQYISFATYCKENWPLHARQAALSDHDTSTKLALKRCRILKGANFTTLHEASQLGLISVVRRLLNSYYCKRRYSTREKSEALCVATACKHLDIAEYLLENGAKPEIFEQEFRDLVLSYDNRDDLLRDFRARKNPRPCPPLLLAIVQGDLRMVQLLQIHGASPNLQYDNRVYLIELFYIAHGRKTICPDLFTAKEMLRLLLPANVSLSQQSGSRSELPMFRMAANAHCINCVTALLDAGAKVNSEDFWGMNLLHYAANLNSPSLARFAIAHGAHLECVTSDGSTPLLLAIRANSETVVQTLIDAGTHLNAVPSGGCTYLAAAVRKASRKQSTAYSIVKKLLDGGACPNERGERDFPLAIAIRATNLELAKLLIDAGAEVNTKIRNSSKSTLLHHVLSTDGTPLLGQQRREFAELLLVNGADPHAVDHAGQSCFHLATKLGEADMIELCADFGADKNKMDLNNETSLILKPSRRTVVK